MHGKMNEEYENATKDDDKSPDVRDACLIKMRGLPWSATVDDVLEFLGDCKVKDGKNGIHLTMSPVGRPSGEAYLEFETPEDAEKALSKDRQSMGHRYIEVFPTTKSEMDWVVSRCGLNLDSIADEKCIRLRGLPYGCTKEEVVSFFPGLAIAPNGISFATDYNGRTTGEAYVQFASKESVEQALKKHMEKMGHRYIEIFRSSLAEIDGLAKPKMRSFGAGYGRSAPYDRGDRQGARNPRYGGGRYRGSDDWEDYESGYGRRGAGAGRRMNDYDDDYGPSRHRIHMRGLPFRAQEDEIMNFFKPYRPISVRILFDRTDRPSGEAIVEFDCHEEAVEAMSKDKQFIQSRYIELMLNSKPDSYGAGRNGGFRSNW